MSKRCIVIASIASCALAVYVCRIALSRGARLSPIIAQDLGPVFVGAKPQRVSTRFEIVNPSRTARLKLAMASKSCTCLMLGAKDTEVPAGGFIEIPLSADVKSVGVAQERVWHVDFDTNREDVPRVRLEMSAFVIPRVTIDGPSGAVLAVHPGATKEVPVTVTIRGPAIGAPLDCRLAASGENMSIVETGRRESMQSAYSTLVIDVVARLECPVDAAVGDRFGGTIDVVMGGERWSREIAWIPSSSVDVYPRALFLTASRSESEIKLTGPAPFGLSEVEVTDSVLVVTYDRGKVAKEMSLGVRLTDDRIESQKRGPQVFRGTIRVETTGTSSAKVVVPFVVVGWTVSRAAVAVPVSEK